MAIDQTNRFLQVRAAALPDAFLLRRLTVSEAIDEPFVINGNLVSETFDIDASSLIGTAITCTVSLPEGAQRHFHGIISMFGRGERVGRDALGIDLFAYHFTAVPRLAYLRYSTDCRIFQGQTVEQIITQVVNDRKAGPTDFTHMPGPTREYCVQFNETDFDFLHRIMDEAGCSYFFKHTAQDHGFTVTGNPLAGFPTASAPVLVTREDIDSPEAVHGWSSRHVAHTARHKNWDFDNLTPSALQQVSQPSASTLTGELASGSEAYRWPGGQVVRPETARADAGDTATLRNRRHEANAVVFSGRCGSPELSAGMKVGVKPGVEASAVNYLIISVTHDAFDNTRLSHQGDQGYANMFSAIPGDKAWRSATRWPRPAVPGLQSAIVTGPSGDEIHCDEHGRIKVHFLWDHRDENRNETSSCYVRVMQPFAGSWGGSWFLPRIGDEVLVAFQDGDPDRPIVVGSVYNADGKPPWTLPGRNTRSGFRSRSTKSGDRSTANIIGFDDLKDSEQVYVQAQKDYLELVKNQKKVTVEGNEIRDVTGASQNQSDGKRTTTVKGDDSLEVKQGNLLTTVKQGDETHEVTQGKRTTTINGNDSLTVKQGNREATISMGNETLTVKMGNMEVKVSMGNITIKAELGSITMEAMQGITLKGGPTSSIEIAPTGITFKSLKIDTQADLMNQTKGAIEQQTGSGMQKIGGSITMIG
jgi:type VI secretion system secreted protein VgrG